MNMNNTVKQTLSVHCCFCARADLITRTKTDVVTSALLSSSVQVLVAWINLSLIMVSNCLVW